MKVQVLNLDGSAAGDVELADDVFGLEPRADILHRVVTWQLENRRGTARGARERSDVARTGKKFGRQKGGGTARHGDRKAPIFIGGGKAHGPRVRDFSVSLNKKVRALGLKMALSSKAQNGLVVIDSLELTDAKTKALAGTLAKAGFGKKVLVVDGEQVNEGFARAARNIVGVNVLPAIGANVYDILKHDTLVLTRAAVEKLEARFNG
ncbi:large subunit ribosomal protein L4 [Novosphingobium capsulatum]|uniref:Large ribosomal subunit protein uL4 n=1 Tax=Novosphingobium capsulatum TaxID=13688 RepID=A0ABU1MIK1_9SPHN|nr:MULTISPECIES: 50S ribosomal protein L4 [Novosphingobium]MBB3356827.1 large subunit ribosomal protein L4 [Novosphingobium sp. BK256]MBB3373228.1 large subunit ribosomal protein L4 [Novosphingobium sp. BK280]MBB3377597.1 large subunit ribosomal protein L4 [Novosphingobium sp. BK258]MBB3418992.1 large subunit ribosomal protein L4 [Novosphingobium sp. BK267]MBB3450173.1 large subunit ribosomal protein L4 [Novosphingobium sp. BK352]MBB3476513.1 large subunit ribosomal protein L4 [Novosphingobiu